MQLQQSPFLSLIPEERIRRTLPLMNQPADARLTPDIAEGVCVRTAGTAVLEGSIAMLGSQYVLGLRAKHCTTGDILADEQAQAARKEEVLSTLSQIATRFRTRVGESLATIEKHSIPLAEATTPSLDALKAFSTGQDTAVFNWDRRLPHYQRAIAIDPEFALAHAQIGFGYSTLGETALGRQSLLKAYQLRHRASDVERLNIETLYDRDVTGNLERERRTLETWAESYPRDPRPRSLIAGLALTSTGQHELAIARTEEVHALNPDATPSYGSMAFNQLFLNRLDEALLTVRRATERKLQSTDLSLIPYAVAFLKEGDEEELRRTGAVARKTPGLVDLIPHLEALALARSGRLQEARRMSAVPVEIAQRSGQRERAALFAAARAVWEGVLRQCGRRQAERQPGARAGQGPQRRLCRGVRAGPRGRSAAIARPRRRSRARVSGGYVRSIHVSADASGPVFIEHSRSGSGHSSAAGRLSLRPPYRWRRLHSTLRRLVPDLRSRTGVSRRPSTRRSRRRVPADSRSSQHSCSSIPWTRWRACSWHERSRSRVTW